MQFGIYTFVENTELPGTGDNIPDGQRIRNLVDEAVLADELGLHLFAIGEHHRQEYLSSAPAVLLSAIAEKTKNIRLSSAVTVLGSEDPVRVFQQFATLDLLSSGRAEIMAGRGSFIESFPLFGYNLNDYDELFAEKLGLLLELRKNKTVDWSGKHRPPIQNRDVYPRPVQNEIPVWIAVGGTPESAYRTGRLGLPMALGIIGGQPKRFTQLAALHRKGAADTGHSKPKLSINSHGFIADTKEEAMDIAFPAFKTTMDRIGRERGWPPMSREQFTASCELEGANFVGSPDQIIEKVLYQHKLFGHDRFLLQMSVGSVPHDKMMRSIELFANEVMPAVNDEIGEPEG